MAGNEINSFPKLKRKYSGYHFNSDSLNEITWSSQQQQFLNFNTGESKLANWELRRGEYSRYVMSEEYSGSSAKWVQAENEVN